MSLESHGRGTLGQSKPHALVVAENQRARVFGGTEDEDDSGGQVRAYQEQNWRNCVLDLQRVLRVAKDLFFVLEHNNEALLRVCVEIVCCEEAQRVLWWTEEWFADDERREWFRRVVAGKLDVCMGGAGQGINLGQDLDLGLQSEEYAEIAKKLANLEEHVREIESEKKMADMKLKEAEDKHHEVKKTVTELEKSNFHLKAELRGKKPDSAAEEEKIALAKQLEEAKQQVKLEEEKTSKVQEKLASVEKEFEKKISFQEEEKAEIRKKAEEEIAAKAKHESEMEAELTRVKDALKRATMVVPTKEKPKEEPPPVKDTGGDAKMKAMVKKFESEKTAKLAAEKQVEELQAKLEGLEATLEGVTKKEIPGLHEANRKSELRGAEALAKVEELQVSLAKAEEKTEEVREEYERKLRKAAEDMRAAVAAAAEAAARGEKVEPPPPPPEPKKPKPKPVEEPKPVAAAPVEAKIVEKVVEKVVHTGINEEQLNEKIQALEKSKERNKTLKAENGELQEKVEALEAKNMKLLKMLHEIKEQLKRVTELAEKKGCGALVSSILEESKVAETLNSAEYTCFNRLYDDAIRRQENHRRIQERFGVSRPSPLKRGASPGPHQTRSPPGPAYAMDESPEAASGVRQAHHGMWSGEAQQQWAGPQQFGGPQQQWGGPQQQWGGPPRGSPYDYNYSPTSNATMSPMQAHMQYMQHATPSQYGSREPSLEYRNPRERSLENRNPRERSLEFQEGRSRSRPASATRSIPQAPINPMREQAFMLPPEGNAAILASPAHHQPLQLHSQTWPDTSGFNFEQASYWLAREQAAPGGVSDGPPGSRRGSRIRPFGLASSHGALPGNALHAQRAGARPLSTGSQGSSHSVQWSMPSAMTMDARSLKERSPSADGRPRRRLIESRTVPELRGQGQEQPAGPGLPPLASRKEAEEMIREVAQTWPGLPSNVRMAMGDANPSSRIPSGRSRPVAGILGSLTGAKKRPPRTDWSKNHEDYLVSGRLPNSGNTFGSGGNMAGWALLGVGAGAAQWYEPDNERPASPVPVKRQLVEGL